VYDSLNFISKLSAGKLLNAARIYSSFYYSRITGQARQWGLPMTMSVEPTTQCNLQCPECPSGLRAFTRPTGSLPLDEFEKFLNQASHHLLWLYFYFQGEPYMNPDFLKMVKMASARKIYTVTSTNAHFLTERKAQETIDSGLDRIIISIDGSSQEVYENYRVGGSLEKVLKGTERLLEARSQSGRRNPHMIFQFLVVKPNEHQMDEVRAFGRKYGVGEVKFKTAQIYDYENGNSLIPTKDEFSRYSKGADGRYSIKNGLDNSCWKLWHSCVMTWDGKIVPCCFDKDASHQLGDLKTDSLRHIWWNEKYAAFRNAIMQSRKEIEICANCSEGTKVWA
jgi:radical SAM protein with 4Fe4S-binding SPASM domain